MTWTWRYERPDGTEVAPSEALPAESFPTQSDAETYIGETWRELRDGGVHAVTLFEDDRLVYGPMGLDPV